MKNLARMVLAVALKMLAAVGIAALLCGGANAQESATTLVSFFISLLLSVEADGTSRPLFRGGRLLRTNSPCVAPAFYGVIPSAAFWREGSAFGL